MDNIFLIDRIDNIDVLLPKGNRSSKTIFCIYLHFNITYLNYYYFKINRIFMDNRYYHKMIIYFKLFKFF